MKTYGQFLQLTVQILTLAGCASAPMSEFERQQYVTKRISESTHCSAADLTIGTRQESVSLSGAYSWSVSCADKDFVCFDTRGSLFCSEVLNENFKKPKIMPFAGKEKKESLK